MTLLLCILAALYLAIRCAPHVRGYRLYQDARKHDWQNPGNYPTWGQGGYGRSESEERETR